VRSLRSKTKPPRSPEAGLVLMTGMLVVMMVTVMALVLIAKRVAVTSKFSMKSRYLQEVQTMVKDPLVETTALFNRDWRRDFFDVGLSPSMNTYFSRVGSLYKVDFSMSSQIWRDVNVYTLKSSAKNRAEDHAKNPLFVSQSTWEAVVSFRQDAPRFEWVFPSAVNLDNLPPFLGGGATVDRTVYVEGDLDTGTLLSETLRGFWVVNGTFTLQSTDSLAANSQVRCRSFVNNGGAKSGVVNQSLYSPPSPGAYVYNPLDPDGIDYYQNNASTSIVVAGGNVTLDFTTFATATDRWQNPEIFIGGVSAGFYTLALDRNVIVVRGADTVTITGGNTQVSYPLVIVALRDGNASGGNIKIQGGFNSYYNVVSNPWSRPPGVCAGAFYFKSDVGLKAFAEMPYYDVSMADSLVKSLIFWGQINQPAV